MQQHECDFYKDLHKIHKKQSTPHVMCNCIANT